MAALKQHEVRRWNWVFTERLKKQKVAKITVHWLKLVTNEHWASLRSLGKNNNNMTERYLGN